MSVGNIVFLCIAVGAITLFGCVLAWASWMEWREKKQAAARASAGEQMVGRIPSTGARGKVAARPF